MGTVLAASDGDLARRAGRLRILSAEQLHAAGLGRSAIRHRTAQGRLQRLWPGVYLVGPDPAGPLSRAYGAAASYTGAAYVTNGWGCMVHGFAEAPEPPVDILVVTGSRTPRDGIRVHRSRKLEARDWDTSVRFPSPALPGRSWAAPRPTR